MNEILKKLPWITSPVVLFWYILYGWGLSAINSPPLYWLIAFCIAAGIVAAMISTLLLAVPASLALSWAIAMPLALETAIFKGNEQIQNLANTFRTGALFFALALVLATFWFSPLFWAKRQMAVKGFSRVQIFWYLTVVSWLGLGLGLLLGKIH